ncbi:hypothetical protein MHA02_13930 [Methylobacterium haplocladii]|uniref:Uncharacterized protein n=1 Tax=Methylobacterium haplocladii TaxID=1176176 RepID=A0A512IMU6_9HYPH|nr:hypothetical protein MHA02_13930 [Methylobacterium haplocladii]
MPGLQRVSAQEQENAGEGEEWQREEDELFQDPAKHMGGLRETGMARLVRLPRFPTTHTDPLRRKALYRNRRS